jgi:hypothetical protein
VKKLKKLKLAVYFMYHILFFYIIIFSNLLVKMNSKIVKREMWCWLREIRLM